MGRVTMKDVADQFVKRFVQGSGASGESAAGEAGAPSAGDGGGQSSKEVLMEQVIEALRQVYDPEIPVNIYDLGLIYDIRIDDDKRVEVDMTLTAPGCPVAQSFPGTVECAVREVAEVNDAAVELVWDPPWTPERMSEDARLQLGLL
jgi:FeS assembly SUF system protein